MKKWLQIDKSDNIAVALAKLEKGTHISGDHFSIKLKNPIRPKHKFTLTNIKLGEQVLMYGVKVGTALKNLNAGEALTLENIKPDKTQNISWSGKYEWLRPERLNVAATWKGYLREDGKFGTRNHWLVIPLVFCENHHIEILRESLEEALGYGVRKKRAFNIAPLIAAVNEGANAEEINAIRLESFQSTDNRNRVFTNIDGVKFITHQSGCGGTRSDSDMFVELVVSYLLNPNCAGATILSLGCQNAQMNQVRDRLSQRAPDYNRPVVWCEEQSFDGEDAFLMEAISKTMAGLVDANKCMRTEAPISALTLGLECGGSDGFSGISANPLLGKISDQIVAEGGNAILSEFPELNGVEQDLANRCVSQEEAQRFIQLMKAYEKHAIDAGSSFDANPSPGNIAEGLLTGAMKSAGAARKGGSAPITSVLDYSEIPEKHGLHLLCTPGNDVESTTALAGSGANLIVFTTGLGTPTGNPVTPVVKMSSNTSLALKMPHLIDFDAGEIIGGHEMESLARDFFSFLIDVASGHPTKSEKNGQDDFIPWKRDISL